MTFFENYLIGGAVVLGFMTSIWLVTLILKNTSIVDIFWGAGFVLLNWYISSWRRRGSLPVNG